MRPIAFMNYAPDMGIVGVVVKGVCFDLVKKLKHLIGNVSSA